MVYKTDCSLRSWQQETPVYGAVALFGADNPSGPRHTSCSRSIPLLSNTSAPVCVKCVENVQEGQEKIQMASANIFNYKFYIFMESGKGVRYEKHILAGQDISLKKPILIYYRGAC